jgi:hypothetical protein
MGVKIFVRMIIWQETAPIRDAGTVKNKAVYLALGINATGRKGLAIELKDYQATNAEVAEAASVGLEPITPVPLRKGLSLPN